VFTFARIKSCQEICYLGEDLVECLAKAVCTKKPINSATSNSFFTLDNVRKRMGHMRLRSRDLLSDVYGPRNISTNRGPGRFVFDKQLKISNFENSNEAMKVLSLIIHRWVMPCSITGLLTGEINCFSVENATFSLKFSDYHS